MATFFGNRNRLHEPVWHVQLAMLVAIVLQLLLPDRFVVFDSRYALITAEALLLIAMSFTTPKERVFRSISRRINVILLIAVTSIANGYSLFEVTRHLLQSHVSNGRDLILAAVNIYITNIIIFGLWYWEMDGGGPGRRAEIARHEQDFMFPQNQNESYKHPHWRPTFIDYLYVSSTNAMAFSPTDTMPLSRRAKVLMLVQATLSLIAVALVAARAVNILH